MQKMDSTISGIVPVLLQSSSATTTNLGPIAVRLLECLQAIHDCHNIVRDVKEENFMLAPLTGKEKGSVETKLASRVRLIDLALCTQWTPSYRETSASPELLGTPLYASLNLHNGQKSSFRDDLEALGYVISELVLKLASGDETQQLPWAKEGSDEDIGTVKEEQVENPKSEFYRGMGNNKTASIVSDYLDEVRSYSFKTRPDYDKLSKILAKLTVARPKTRAASAKTPPRRAATTPAKRGRSKAPPVASAAAPASDKSEKDDDDDDVISMDWDYTTDENKKPKGDDTQSTSRQQRASRRANLKVPDHDDDDVIVIDDDDDDDDVKMNSTAHTSKRAKKSAPTKSDITGGTGNGLKSVGVLVEIIEGPHAGESFGLESGGCETVVVGTKPLAKSGTAIILKKDKTLKASHVKLDLSVSKRNIVSLIVTDKSQGDTAINRNSIKSSKAFINDSIIIGNTVLVVKSA